LKYRTGETLRDFVQRHAESLGPADETQRSDRVIVVDPIAIWQTLRAQQAVGLNYATPLLAMLVLAATGRQSFSDKWAERTSRRASIRTWVA
jgi:hypothetical protein